MPYKAVLFDLDGTLLDTIDDLADSMNHALAACELPTQDDVERHKYFVGDGVRNYVLRAVPPEARADQALLDRVEAVYRRRYAANWRNKTRVYEGIGELIDELRRRGLRTAVLSNKPDATTQLTVRDYLGLERFDAVRGAHEGEPLKPDPRAALAIAAEPGIPPADWAYVGDTATDMRTAVAAGMYPIGALWGFRTADELRTGGAKVLAKAPMDVLACVKSE